ncbi:Structure-specific endonuclease subunit slx4 [Fulvia fulva]|nr:Structure-specific endonuclease subunit slx4 [Fulvia fulva]WPV14360.1 Structure-specific endonuclease subunit slx4 [Fulvia fulva]WPV28788.1 Structure-specific endonuclease subunit slx4 [Fulvia fulva]
MAARSPIVLDSPSPTVSELPPITPQHHRKSSSVATDSSPGLLSIGKLPRPANAGLISGIRVQELPQGAKADFASAASLWKAQKSEAEAGTARQQDEDTAILKAATDVDTASNNAGRLPRRKRTEERAPSREPSITAQSPLSAYAYQDGNERRKSISASPAPTQRFNAEPVQLQDPQPARVPSRSLSEYDFRPEEHTTLHAPTLPSEPVKKPRKSRAKVDDATADGQAKKPRKRTAKNAEPGEGTKKKSRQPLKKSESTVLNSDDLAATQANTYSRIEIPSPPPKIKRMRKTTSKSASMPAGDAPLNNIDTTKVTSERSTYFDEAPKQDEEELPARAATEDLDEVQASDTVGRQGFARDSTSKSPTLPQAAPRRRLSWTPTKKTVIKILDDHETAPAIDSGDAETTTKSLADIVSGFGYASGSAYVPPTAGQRSASGEALTKRRRIDLADEATKAPARRRASPRPAPAEKAEKPKKAKAPKKKPQTITDLATKAYRAPEEEEASAQPTVSEFFTAQKADTVLVADSNADDTIVKPKKPRKPRTKKVDGNGSKPTSALKTKPKKAKKVRIVEDDHLAILHTPGEARAQERSQDFLFGTSSQLGVDDSPTFIRDMQIAVRESEVVPPSQIDGPKSRARVLNGPDSVTSLSIIQANKDLWCTAARDTDGDVMRLDSATIRIVQARETRDVQKPPDSAVNPAAPSNLMEDTSPQRIVHVPRFSQDLGGITSPAEAPTMKEPAPIAHESVLEQDIVDLCHTSPIAENTNAMLPIAPDMPEVMAPPSADSMAVQNAILDANEPRSEEIWAILPSDSPPEEQPDMPPLPAAVGIHSPSKRNIRTIPQLRRSATSPIRQRTALQALDANISPLPLTSPGKGRAPALQRFLATPAVSSPPKRGRPKKSITTDDTSAVSPRKRGRPRKTDSLTSPKPKKAVGTSASQPVQSRSSGFENIDEISDSDSPTTPSPPRRRAASSPPEARTLELDTVASPSKSTMPRTALLTLKPGDHYFVIAIQPSLFPQITNTVKSAPPSNSLTNSSWHEKILLYDPIVLEDFTAWLNEQGLRIELQRLKPKTKTKGRKKKDAPLVPDEPEYETVKEELKPWMVQKWCEEKSVCCLWKEGLRGGVRTRY